VWPSVCRGYPVLPSLRSRLVNDLATAVAAGDLDALIRLVDGLCSSREWGQVVELGERCRHALEQRGLQLWPAAEYAEYRLALEAPGELAGSVVDEEAGRFALGPLWEVAASTHSWDLLAAHIAPGPARALAAHERVLRGEDLSGDDTVDRMVLEIPLRLLAWEPSYATATFRADEADFDAPSGPRLSPVVLPEPGVGVDDEQSIEALLDVGAVWAQQSNGSASAVAVQGSAEDAIAALGHTECLLADASAADAFARIAWAGASGGAYGRRRGGSVGRFVAWWLAATLTDLAWPVDPAHMESAVTELRWVVWEPPGFTGGWSACVAAESSAEGMAWALETVDSHREEDVLADT
jgi:resuscitation-promoting factor RpfA